MTTEANNTTERKALNLVQRIVANRLENENGKYLSPRWRIDMKLSA